MIFEGNSITLPPNFQSIGCNQPTHKNTAIVLLEISIGFKLLPAAIILNFEQN